MTVTTVSAAIRSGATRGFRLAMNPSMENYRRLRTPQRDVTSKAWESVGRSLSSAMQTESRSQASSRRSS